MLGSKVPAGSVGRFSFCLCWRTEPGHQKTSDSLDYGHDSSFNALVIQEPGKASKAKFHLKNTIAECDWIPNILYFIFAAIESNWTALSSVSVGKRNMDFLLLKMSCTLRSQSKILVLSTKSNCLNYKILYIQIQKMFQKVSHKVSELSRANLQQGK